MKCELPVNSLPKIFWGTMVLTPVMMEFHPDVITRVKQFRDNTRYVRIIDKTFMEKFQVIRYVYKYLHNVATLAVVVKPLMFPKPTDLRRI